MGNKTLYTTTFITLFTGIYIILLYVPAYFMTVVTIGWGAMLSFTGYTFCKEILHTALADKKGKDAAEEAVSFYHLIYFPFYLVSRLTCATSTKHLERAIYFFAFRLFRYRYDVILQNLSRALPHKSYPEIRHLVKEYYRHLASLITENLQSLSISEQRQKKRLKFANPELLNGLYRKNRPVIVLMGHYGNWECLNILPLLTPFTVNAIYKPLSSKVMDKIIHRIRTRFGMRLLPAQQAPRYLLKQKDRSQLTLFIADQYPGENVRCHTDFLHQSTPMFTGAEKVAKLTDAAVIYLEMVKKTKDCWQVNTSLITENASRTPEGEVTRKFAAKLQQTIEKSPPFWLWSHKRWK